jgi:maleylacetoacetate isomerase
LYYSRVRSARAIAMLGTRAMTALLYSQWSSSCSYRVRFALHLKGIAYQTCAVALGAGEQHTTAHRARSPMATVPCLVLDGVPFIESVAIVELLDDLVAAPRLYPRDPFDRARVRALVEIINAGTQPLQNRSVRERHSEEPAAQDGWSRHFIRRGLAAFEHLMASHAARGVAGRYAYGDTLTAADVFLVPQVYNAQQLDLDLTGFPRVVAASTAAAGSPAARAAAPEQQPDAPPRAADP